MRNTLTVVSLLVFFGCGAGYAGYAPPQPEFYCNISSKSGMLEKPTYRVTATLSADGRFLSVFYANSSSEPVQLLLQEWSVTTSRGTSSIVPDDTPNGQVQSIVLSPISLPAGADYRKGIYPRSLHHYVYRDFSLEPMTDGTSCGSTGEIKLTVVFLAGEKKTLETVTIPFEIQQVPNPQYQPPAKKT